MEELKRTVTFVKPVSKGKILYQELRAAKNKGHAPNGGVLLASDLATKKQLWTLEIYKTRYELAEEIDGQEVYFKSLKAHLLANKLTIVN